MSVASNREIASTGFDGKPNRDRSVQCKRALAIVLLLGDNWSMN